MRFVMKRATKSFFSFSAKILAVLLIILVLPYARKAFRDLFPDLTGEIHTQSSVLEQKLLSSSRLEVMTVKEDGVMVAKTNVVVLGTVGQTTIRYCYTASIGIDLSKVRLVTEEDRIIFHLPEPEILNDGIEAVRVDKQNFLSYAIDKSTETLLLEQKLKCREEYLSNPEHLEKAWHNTTLAFEKTICEWLDGYERHYRFEFVRDTDPAALQSGLFYSVFVRLDGRSFFAYY